MALNLGEWGNLSTIMLVSQVVSIGAIASMISGDLPAQAQVLTFQGTTNGQWGMPSNPSGSTFLSSENGGIDNRLT